MPLRSAQGDAAEDAGEADDDSALVRRVLRGLAAQLDALGEQTAADLKELRAELKADTKELKADTKELKQTVGSISETVGAMAQRDALMLASGTLPQPHIKGAVVHTLASCARCWA